MTRVAERMTLRAVCGFHQPSPAQATSLEPAWSAALRVAGTAAGEVELYVQPARAPNAYAAGGRGVAVTSRIMEGYRAGRLPEDQLVAVLVHELGHHGVALKAAGHGSDSADAAPDMAHSAVARTASVLAGLASIMAGRHPRQGLGVVVLAGLAVPPDPHRAERVVTRCRAVVGCALNQRGRLTCR